MLISSFFHFKGLIFSPSTFVLFKKEEEDKSYHIALLYETGSLWSALVLDFCPHRRGLTKINSPKKIMCLTKNHLTQISWAFLSPRSLSPPKDQWWWYLLSSSIKGQNTKRKSALATFSGTLPSLQLSLWTIFLAGSKLSERHDWCRCPHLSVWWVLW